MDDLINTLECPGEFDAMANIRPGEPYFLLLGRDRIAPKNISDWADLNRRRALADHADDKIGNDELERELRKSTQAEMIAASMIAYKAGWDEKKALEPTSKPSYTGHELPDETAARDAMQSARARAVSGLHNAIAECAALAQLMNDQTIAGHGSHDPHDVQVVVGRMREAVDCITPKRPAS